MESKSELEIDRRQMVVAIETAVDLVGMNDTSHGKRVGYIASQIAYAMGQDEGEIQSIFELGLLHDCGVSSDQVHENLVNHFDWQDVQIHCEIGQALLKSFEPLADFALPILHHHTPWNELQYSDLSERDRFRANLIFLADRIDVMSSSHYGKDILLARKDIVEVIRSHGGHYFDPELVEVFCEIEQTEAFWIALEERHVIHYTEEMARLEQKCRLNCSQLKQFAKILSYIVDQKSAYTAQHSARVGILARYIAGMSGIEGVKLDKIEIAGFLHDIGKLRTPDSILKKAGPLTAEERSVISHHSFETYEILRKIDGLQEIAVWAAYHHEEVNQGGYPFHPAGDDFSVEARIIAVADVFQAMVQDRPYRDGMTLDEVIQVMEADVISGKLDGEIVELVKENRDRCFAIALGEAEENQGNEVPDLLNTITYNSSMGSTSIDQRA